MGICWRAGAGQGWKGPYQYSNSARRKYYAADINCYKLVADSYQQTEAVFEGITVCNTFNRKGKLAVDAVLDAQLSEVLSEECQADVGCCSQDKQLQNKTGHKGFTSRVSTTSCLCF